jgi:hypothetical protein
MKILVNHDHVKMILIEKKDNTMRMKVDHWKVLVVHLIMMDIFHDDLMIDQIEMMMVNGHHNNLIDHYLFD